MDYEPLDSSGTDDDLLPIHQNRVPIGGHLAGNGRSAVGSVSYSKMYGETDMEAQIRQLELEAYSSVLRAFKARADTISWDQQTLISELRKELKLTNEEYSELLGRANADDLIRRIREWRQAGSHQPGLLSAGQAIHYSISSPTVSASRKKQKLTLSQSYGGPSSTFHPQTAAAPNQPSSAAKRGSVSGSKGKKSKSGLLLPGVSSMKRYPSSGPGGRNQMANRVSSGAVMGEPADGATYNQLIGRRVRTRWPDDNNFYEAVITSYDQAEGRHSLVYDMGSTNETWEWVNLAEIPPQDIRWVEEDTGINHHGAYGGFSHGMRRSIGLYSIPGAGRDRGSAKGQSRKDILPSKNGIGKKGQNDIRFRNTDSLIKEVERVFRANHPDPVGIEKAKKVLKEQEQALVDAIARIEDLSYGERCTYHFIIFYGIFSELSFLMYSSEKSVGLTGASKFKCVSILSIVLSINESWIYKNGISVVGPIQLGSLGGIINPSIMFLSKTRKCVRT